MFLTLSRIFLVTEKYIVLSQRVIGGIWQLTIIVYIFCNVGLWDFYIF